MRSSPGVETTELRDQLFSCPDENLRTALHRSHREKLFTITVAGLLDEIKKLAVVRQSNNVNTLALMNQFVARLRLKGLAAVCDLSVTCSCGTKVLEVDKWVRMSLIGGLNGEDTMQEVMSKVEELPLDTRKKIGIRRIQGKKTTRNAKGR